MTPLILLSASIASFAVLAFWFSYEERKGVRALSRWRGALDRAVDASGDMLARLTRALEVGIFFGFLYRTTRSLVALAERATTTLEQRTRALACQNEERATRLGAASAVPGQTSSVLGHISEHKAATMLTDEQKAEKLQAHLEGRV